MLYIISIHNKKKIFLYLFKSILILILLLVIGEIINRFIHFDNIYFSLLFKTGIMSIIILAFTPLLGINVLFYFNQLLNKWNLKI